MKTEDARIIVRRLVDGYYWSTNVSVFVIHDLGRQGAGMSYATADHALRDAWTWWPELPALIYTRRP